MLLLKTSPPLKRQRSAVDSDIEDHTPTAKKAKLDLIRHGHRPSGYWDTLSKVWLTRGSLAEFDRRTALDKKSRAPRSSRPKRSASLAETDQQKLKLFARRGGPDLTKLRGFSTPCPLSPCAMSRSSGSSRSRHRPSTSGTRGSTARSSPYSGDFEQKLTDHGIHITSKGIKPQNISEIRAALNQPRPSLSPSQFSEGAFERFVEDNDRAVKESRVMSDVVPTIAGTADRRHLSMDNVQLQDLESFADGQITAATPDRYYGADLKDIDPRVRHALGHHIIPSTDQRLPAAPNFFLEAKSTSGRTDVAKRQTCHDGAIGARAMHSLKNYDMPNPVHDGQAHTITSIYHDGTLKMYAHHTTQPQPHGDAPEYHMTPVRGVTMTDSVDSFRQGAAAYRNARDWTQKQRDALIAQANTRARAGSPDLISFASTDLSHSTSVPDACHDESDTSADELALDRVSATGRQRKTPASRQLSKTPAITESEQPVNLQGRHKSSNRHHRNSPPPQALPFSQTVAQPQRHVESDRHSSYSITPRVEHDQLETDYSS